MNSGCRSNPHFAFHDDVVNRSVRDRSVVTVAALIARSQTIELPIHVNLALEEIITHLEFYSGWANAMSAVSIAKHAFAHEIGVDQPPSAPARLLPRVLHLPCHRIDVHRPFKQALAKGYTPSPCASETIRQ